LKKSTAPAPPKDLSAAACTWWKRLHAEFDLADEAAAFLLESALRAFDRMNQAGALVEKHGVCIVDRFGQLRANPATNAERDARAAMLSAFKQLNLDVIPPMKPGRPAGR
jgi:P27 family predicted phage terminase small subunit